MPKSLRTPSYRRHRPTGQAVVTLNGKDHYLGKWDTAVSKAEYKRLIGEWLTAGTYLPTSNDLTVAELCAAFWRHAKGYYRIRPGGSRGSIERVRLALRRLKETYGHTLAKDFRPLALQAIQRCLAETGNSRTYVNRLVQTIKQMFKWAVSQEMVDVTVHQALATVPGLKMGRSPAREPEPIKPVADEIVEATLPHLPPIVADMVRLQRLSGSRPGEICILRPCDVDTTGNVWTYRPEFHKTEHHCRDRVIFIGPKGQDVLRPYLLRDKSAYCFVPVESERKRNTAKRENRKSPMTPSQARRRRKRNPKRVPGDRYTTGSYRQTVTRGVKKANKVQQKEAGEAGGDPVLLPNWHPNQLRHTAATEIRRVGGLEAAQVALGHAKADVTQIYAERDVNLAMEVMRKIG
jgi:integrase